MPAPTAETLLAQAVDLPDPAERAAFLDRACGHDAALRAEVGQLADLHFRAGDFLEPPSLPSGETAAYPPTSGAAETVGTQVGPYLLRELLGEGGMGAVYVADQTEPVRRRVAVKLIRPGMGSREVVARFEQERQALALMDHPGIAKVLDGGTAPDGRPYFVMELVRGLPVTDYCDRAGLTVRDRLRLFAQVCRAVQHAHQKGVIHRDLKPSNVLVTLYDGTPAPKVIDFGIAKAVGAKLAADTVYTRFAQLVGTPLYMSPEQAELSALDVDTRSDVYSLGVLLYELLTGTTPFDPEAVRTAGLDEVRRMIREDDPPRPSARVSTLAAEARSTASARRGLDDRRLARALRGDLDWVVMTALEKDRNRRYEGAGAFAADVDRFLADEPVHARPPSTLYRVRKFARRHRVALVSGGLVAAALVAGTGVSVWQAVEARAARIQAEGDRDKAKTAQGQAVEEAKNAEAVAEFFQDVLTHADAVGQVRGELPGDPNLTVKQAVDRAAAAVGKRFQGRPKFEGSVRSAIGGIYLSLGEMKSAVAHLERSLELSTAVNGPDHRYTFNVTGNLGAAYKHVGRPADAARLFERALAMTSAPDAGPDLVLSVSALLGETYLDLDRAADAVRLLEPALRTARSDLGLGHPETTMVAAALAKAYRASGRSGDAVALLRRLRDERAEQIGRRHLETLRTTRHLAEAVEAAGPRVPGGIDVVALREEVLAGYEATVGPDHPDTLIAMHDLAADYVFTKKDKTVALDLFARSVAGLTARLGPTHPNTLNAMLLYTYPLRLDPARNAQAVALNEKVVAAYRATRGDGHPDTVNAVYALAWTHAAGRRWAAAVPLLEDVLARQAKFPGKAHPDTQLTVRMLGTAYRELARWDKATAHYREWAAASREANGPGHRQTLSLLNAYAEAARRSGAGAEAVKAMEGVVEASLAARGPTHPDTLAARLALADAYDAAADWVKAAAEAEAVAAARRAKPGPDHPDTRAALTRLSDVYRRAGRWADAERVDRELLALAAARHGPDHPDTLAVTGRVAALLQASGRAGEAVTLYEGVVPKLAKAPGPAHPDTLAASSGLGQAYLRAGRPADAERVLRDVISRRTAAQPNAPPPIDDLAALGGALLDQGRPADAEPVLRDAVRAAEAANLPDWQRGWLRNLLGAAVAGRGKPAEAEPLLVQGYEAMERAGASLPAPWRWHRTAAGERVVRFYEATGRLEKAKAWRDRLAAGTPARE